MGQEADVTALLKRGDETVDARLRAQIERILHFVERRGNAGFLEALMNKAQQFSLLAGQHRRVLSGLRP